MSTINSLAQNFSPSATSGASAARTTDTDNGLGKVAEGFAGIEGLSGAANNTPFSTGNPGFGARGGEAGFGVSNFLG